MKLNKEFVLKNLITICCGASILLLFLPIFTSTTSLSISGVGAGADTSYTGFQSLSTSITSYLLILCPAVLIAMNYISQLDKYKSILAIVLPVVSIIALIITFFITKSNSVSVGGAGISAKVSFYPSIGFYLLLIAYIATLVSGAMTFYGLKLSKDGVKDFKDRVAREGISGMVAASNEDGNGIPVSAEPKSYTGQGENSFSSSLSGMADKIADKASSARETVSALTSSAAKPSNNIKHSEEILGLIANLSEMKEKGILTEEEFTQKKQELLTQI